jgi:N-acetylglucosamine-6-phosphate deacetylase
VIAGEVAIASGCISAICSEADCGEGGRGGGGRDGDVVELGERWLVPGYIDTHVHGGGGAQFNTCDPEEVDAAVRFHSGHGTTALLATTVSAALDDLVAALGVIAGCARERSVARAQVLGVHLEGPFLSAARAGAMDASSFLPPDLRTLERLLGVARGGVRMMTLAPELPGALDLVRALVRAGAIASIGHSDAGYEEARAAVRAGASAGTHLFNAMPPFHHREPGLVGAALDLPEVSCELICDGVHVDPAALRLAYRAKGAVGVRLVTDAMAGAGMAGGRYPLGAAVVEVRGGRALLGQGRVLAGSTLTMDVAVRNAVRFLGVPVQEAVEMASTNPARLLGVSNRKGAISVGMDADLVVLDENLLAGATMIGGRWIGPSPAC